MCEPLTAEYKTRWTVPELAERLGVTPQRIRQLIDSHELEAVKYGRDWIITDSEVQRVLKVRSG
jgi:excisionase family DNA binding protein